MKQWLRITSIFSLILICFFDQEVFSQPFSLANIPQHASSFSVAPNCIVTITSSGDGTQQWQGSAIAANGLGGTAGAVAQNCANQTGLRLEMIGAGNSSGTLAWNNSITVVFAFPQGVKGPVTFNIYDLTEPLYNDGTYNYANYQDKVTISSTRCDGVTVTPNLTTNNGPISSAAVGSSMGLTAIRTQGQCLNEPISIGSAFDVIKTITIVYSNQDPPTNITAPVGPNARFGISQYQYIFIGNINAIAPSAINVTATPNTICAGQTSTLNASSAGAYTYSWASGTIPTTGASVAATPSMTTIYTVSGSSGSCIQTNTVTVNVNPSTVPTFNALGPYCVGATPGSLPTTSTNGINGSWSPANISTATAGTTVYNFTPAAGACATATSMSVTISSGFTPTFTAMGPYCVGSVAGSLPPTSTNGISGSWSPSAISTAVAGTSVYSFTPNAGQCGANTSMNVTVNANVAPTFTALGPYCIGASPGTLPTTSINGISGTWNPATISTAAAGTTVYVFTPTLGQCALSTTMSVTVNPNVSSSFAALGPYCIGAVPGVLQATSINGISGSWNPASISTASAGTTIYTFTPTAGQCAATATMNVTVNTNAVPSFAPLGPYCVGAVPATLPANSTNGFSGTWNPATISTAAAGTTVYTFTPSAGQCASTTTLNITVNANIAPTFAAMGPYCVGAVPGVLPTTSTNGVSGTWNPVAISTAAAGTTVYTFTHTAGQCATNTTLSVTVNAPTIPTFAAFGPYCIGSVPGTLPTNSTNGINGTWSPATISTATAGTTVYTFTPAAGQCASTTTKSVVVNAQTVPNFAAIPAFCFGAVAPVLTATSPNGITGTWSPVIISNTTGATYTFTPNAGQCATTQALNVVVNPLPNVTAGSNPSPAVICAGQNLTLNSSGAGSYVWMPGNLTGNSINVNPTLSTVYTVTGTSLGCTNSAGINVTVNPLPSVTVNSAAVCPGDSATLTASGATSYTWNPGGSAGASVVVTPSSTTIYTVVGTSAAGCSNSAGATVTVNPQPTITASANPANVCTGHCTDLTASGGVSYTWQPGGTTGQTFHVCPMAATAYSVVGTSAAGCSGSATVNVSLSSSITVSVSPSVNTICKGSQQTLTASGGNTYVWTPSTGLSSANGTVLIAAPLINTVYTVLGSSAGGCTGSTTATVNLYPDVPVNFQTTPSVGCEPLTVNFAFDTNNPLIDLNSLVYNFDDPTSAVNSANSALASHTFNDHGYYLVRLTANTNNGCPVSFADTVRVYKIPIAGFTFRPTVVYSDDPHVQFYDQSYNSTTWNWSFGDPTSIINNNTSQLQFPTHIYSDTGIYQVILAVSNHNVCFDTAVQYVKVLPPFMFWVPNSFSPNGDGTNDSFYGKGDGFRTDDYEMIVYDRWGEMVYSRKGYDETGWNGSYNGKSTICEVGVYSYYIKLTETGGIIHVYTGVVYLIP